jgi:hypothetical protein
VKYLKKNTGFLEILTVIAGFIVIAGSVIAGVNCTSEKECLPPSMQNLLLAHDGLIPVPEARASMTHT